MAEGRTGGESARSGEEVVLEEGEERVDVVRRHVGDLVPARPVISIFSRRSNEQERNAPPHPTRVLSLLPFPDRLDALEPFVPLRQPLHARTPFVLGLETPDHLADHDERGE